MGFLPRVIRDGGSDTVSGLFPFDPGPSLEALTIAKDACGVVRKPESLVRIAACPRINLVSCSSRLILTTPPEKHVDTYRVRLRSSLVWIPWSGRGGGHRHGHGLGAGASLLYCMIILQTASRILFNIPQLLAPFYDRHNYV